jgi:hypothetical protein
VDLRAGPASVDLVRAGLEAPSDQVPDDHRARRTRYHAERHAVGQDFTTSEAHVRPTHYKKATKPQFRSLEGERANDEESR